MRKFAIVFLVVVFATSGLSQRAFAIKQFFDEFVKLYAGEDAKPEFRELVKKKAKCYCCHQGRKSKKNHNSYGVHLVKLLDKKKDKKEPEKIVEALKKVAAMHTDAKDDKSPTYGDLIKAGKLPGGSLEAAKKEPKKKKGEEDKGEEDKGDKPSPPDLPAN